MEVTGFWIKKQKSKKTFESIFFKKQQKFPQSP